MATKKHHRHTMKLVSARFRHTHLFSSWQTWIDLVSARRSQRRRMLTLMVSLRHHRTEWGFRVWMRNTLRESRGGINAVKIRSMAFRLQHRHVLSCFHRWCERVNRRRRIRVIQKVMQDSGYSEFSADMALGFTAWKKLFEAKLQPMGWILNDVIHCMNDFSTIIMATKDPSAPAESQNVARDRPPSPSYPPPGRRPPSPPYPPPVRLSPKKTLRGTTQG